MSLRSAVVEDQKTENVTSGILLEGLQIEDDGIAKTLEESSFWTRLEMVSCGGSRMPHLVETALCQKSVQQLALRKTSSSRTSLMEDSLFAINLSGMRYLKELILEVDLSERSCRYLASAITKIPSSLLCLRLEGCSFENATALAIFAQGMKRSYTISTFVLTKCHLTDDDFKNLIPNLPTSVRVLDLTDNFCRSEVITSIGPTLRSLNLTNQHPEELGGSLDISLVARTIEYNQTLQELDLSFNLLTSGDVCDLIDALEENTTLESLNLMNNQLDDSAMLHIGKLLPQMKGLRYLNITANRFGDHGADALFRGLLRNYQLTRLEMPRGFDAQNKINYLVALNQGGRRLVKADDILVPLGIWPLVLERVNMLSDKEMARSVRASVLFFLLREGTAMIDCK